MALTKRRDRHPETASPILDLDLEAQIARAEQSVMARDRRIGHHVDAIRASVSIGPRRLLKRHRGLALAVAATGAGVAGLVVWWRWRVASKVGQGATSGAVPRGRRKAALSDMIPLAWRLLPAVLKDTVMKSMRAELRRIVASFSKSGRHDEAPPAAGGASAAQSEATRTAQRRTRMG